MSQTLNINYDPYAPGTFALTFTVNGVAPNLSTGYGATMRIWRSGLPTTAAPDVTVTHPTAIALGTSGSIVLDLVVIHAALALVSSTNAVWVYDLVVTPTGSYSQKVCSGQLSEGVGSDQAADVTAPISVNWAGTVGGDLAGTLPNPTVDGLQGRAVASTAPTNGQVLAWNSSTSAWEPTTGGGGGSGTVTSITAGTGLTGGTITTSGTIAADIGTGATQVAAGNHTHTLAGDVQGDIAATVVHKVHGHEFSSGTPSNGDVWVWESTSTKWKHETLATAGIAAAVHTHAAADVVSGTLDAARLGSGTANSGTWLRGDSTWQALPTAAVTTISEYTYSTSGTYTKPAGLQYIIVEGCGGGGGGGSGSASAGGNGGCGGLWFNATIPAALITTSTMDVTIGAGGGAGVNGGDSELQLASGGAKLAIFQGGRAATTDTKTMAGGVQTNGFSAGGSATAGTGGRHGGMGPGGGGAGQNNTTGAGLAGGAPASTAFTATVASQTGGAAGGANGGGAGTNATLTLRGFGEGGGGGGANNAGNGGNGGNGTRGSGGGGGGRGSVAGGTGGSGGNGYIRIIEVVVA